MSFNYQCNRDLKAYLGRLDAFIELNELAIRSFKASAEESSNVQQYIETISSKHSIQVRFEVFPNLHTWAAQNYIVAVHEAVYLFLYEYRREFVRLHEKNYDLDWPDIEGNKLEDALNKVSTLCRITDICSLVGEEKIAIFNYYHFLRNRLAHPHSRKKEDLDSEFQKVQKYSKNICESYKVDNAPNHIDHLTFYDFYLFSRASKDIAQALSEVGKPTPKQIAKAVGLEKLKLAKQFMTKPERMRQFVSRVVEPHYGLLESGDIDSIIEVITETH